MFHYVFCWDEMSASDIDGEAEEIQEVRSDDWHKDISDEELPRVPFGVVVEGALHISVSADGGTVCCFHDER